jgi:peptide-methionine (S)-S-oxide reductase
MKPLSIRSWIVLSASAVATLACGPLLATGVPVPPPAIDAPLATTKTEARAVIAGGCFWGIEAVYRHTRGVTRATSGYAGGSADSAHYDVVGSGRTDHAESVEVVYDPSQITYGRLLQIFFSVAHDPTQLNRQGPDAGRQYRSAIFTADADQARIARAYIAQLNEARVFRQPIVTEVTALPRFYEAEDYHQNYAALHPNDPYIRINDAPKVESLRRMYPDLFVEK